MNFFSHPLSRLACVLLLLSAAGIWHSAWAASAQETLEQFAKTRPFADGRFNQVVLSNTGAVKQKGSGEFSFARPGKFRWEIIKPYPQLILADGNHVVAYDPDLQQATQKPMGNALDATPAALLFGGHDLNKLFTLKEEGSKDGKQWLVARPKNKETLFDYVRIAFKDNVPCNLDIYDALGQVTQLELTHWNFETKRPASFYTFKAPEGVELIQMQ